MAPCPLCHREKGISEPKPLYAVYGPDPTECDRHIPAKWFETPPIRLDDQEPTISALRVCFLNIEKTENKLNLYSFNIWH